MNATRQDTVERISCASFAVFVYWPPLYMKGWNVFGTRFDAASMFVNCEPAPFPMATAIVLS